MFRWHVVSAVFWRNVKQYFSGPLGYLFIVVFVTVCAVMAFSPQFFADNQATLDQLSRYFPVLLLFFVPAVTMSVWADEKRQGTDSILFTLPASDFDILLGKYLSVAAVYTIALLFSLTQVIALEILGNPDWGVICSTYVGYWLAGLALLSVGMFASSLTGSATVAFVLGAIFCSVPVLIDFMFSQIDLQAWFGIDLEINVERFGFAWNLSDFTLGLIPLGNVVYFLGLTVLMLYLNLIVISKRHWSRGQQVSLGGQFFLRAVSLAVVLISLAFLSNTMVSSLWSRADLTSESLYSLDKATLATLEKVRTNDLEVTIQAFVSKDVPRKFVNAKKQFVGLLRQFGEYGGKNINVRFVDVEPNSDEALDAKQQGIVPQDDRSEVAGKIVEQPVYLGAIISSSLNDVSLPFVGDDAAIEYELSRGIDSAIDTTKGVTLGILDTDALFGGPEVEGRRYPMAFAKTLERLKKQYKIKYIGSAELGEYVEPVGADTLAEEAGEEKKKVNQAPDVLLVADPSSLDDAAMVSLVSYVKAGNPTILLTDPLPFFWVSKYPRNVGVISAPSQPRFGERSPYFRTFSTSALPKSDEGSALKMMRAIGVDWDKGAAAWSVNDPHPSFKPAWSPQLGKRWPAGYGPEEKAFVFVRNVGESLAFNSESLMSQGLNELLMFYPGSIKKTVGSNLNFQPLVTLGKQSGKTPWEQLTKTPMQTTQSLDPRTRRITSQTGPEQNQITLNDTVIMEPAPQTFLDEEEHVLAARITGNEDQDLDVVVIADSDFVSDIYYEQQEALGQRLDNVAFLENAIDILVGNDDFVALRNRRATPRTLEKLESVIEEYRAEKAREQQKAESKVAKELGIEQDKLAEANKEIVGNQDLGYFQKLQQTRQQESDAERRFGLKQKRLDRELKDEIERLDTEQKNKISWLENRARFTSIFAAPLPALLLGVFVLWFRKLNEEKDIATERRVGRFS